MEEGSKGSLVGSIIVVLVLVLGGLYFLLVRENAPATLPTETATSTDEGDFQTEE